MKAPRSRYHHQQQQQQLHYVSLTLLLIMATMGSALEWNLDLLYRRDCPACANLLRTWPSVQSPSFQSRMVDCSMEDCSFHKGMLPAVSLRSSLLHLTRDAASLTAQQMHEWAARQKACMSGESQSGAEFVVESDDEAMLVASARLICPSDAGRVAFVVSQEQGSRIHYGRTMRSLALRGVWDANQVQLLVAPLNHLSADKLLLALRKVQGLPLGVFYLRRGDSGDLKVAKEVASQLALQVVSLYTDEPAHYARVSQGSTKQGSLHFSLGEASYHGEAEPRALVEWARNQLASHMQVSSFTLRSDRVISLTAEEQDELGQLTSRGGNVVTVVLFFDEKCAHCKNARLSFHRAAETLAQDSAEQKITFVESEWVEHPLVHGLPSVIAWTNNRPTRFTKEKTWLDLVEFAQSQTVKSVVFNDDECASSSTLATPN